MALFSMTGYGQGRASLEGMELTVDIHSLNGRFLDIGLRLPKRLQAWEPQVRRQVQETLVRGKISISVLYAEENGAQPEPRLNSGRLKQYQQLFRRMAQELAIKEEPGLSHYTRLHDVIDLEESDQADLLGKLLPQALGEALSNLQEMRRLEGLNLAQDLNEHRGAVRGALGEIEGQAEADKAAQLQGYRDRIQELLKGVPVDEARLLQEAAIMADKRDISEECTRLKSHLALFDNYMAAENANGKRLGFLLQEMGREANTIGAKSNRIRIRHLVVELKDELEKIREQVQNIL